jgi:DNA-binding NarL/FixJ family response regulator
MKTRVLLADDHALFREGLKLLLAASHDIDVVGEASTGMEAVALARSTKPDVAVLDFAMPELNGAEAARQIRVESPCTRILALSMHDDKEHALLMLEAGATGYMLKNAPSADLLEAIQRVARGELIFGCAAAQGMLQVHLERVQGAASRPAPELTARQAAVLQLIAEGKSTKEIAVFLRVSTKTVETYRAQLMSRLDIHSIAGLTKYAIRKGLIDP